MRGVAAIFMVLGLVATAVFLRDPSFARQPQLVLFASTALVGSGVLWLLARVLRDRPLD